MPRMFNERHIYHHLVESLQGTAEGSNLDKCDNIELDYNKSKPCRRSERFFPRSGHVTCMRDYRNKTTAIVKITM